MKNLLIIIIIILSSQTIAQNAYDFDFGASFKEVFEDVGAQPGVTIGENEDGTMHIIVEGNVTHKVYMFNEREQLKEVYIIGNSAAISVIIANMIRTEELEHIEGGKYTHMPTGNKWETVMPYNARDIWTIIISKD